MPGELRAIRRRIDSTQSIQKITRAMELIASSRVLRAQQRVQRARPYASELKRLMASVSARAGRVEHPLLEQREVTTAGILVVASDRGLAGAYNANVIRLAEREIGVGQEEKKLWLVGRRAVSYFRFRGYTYENSWLGVTDRPRIEQAREVASALADAYREKVVDRVDIVYTRFESALVQRPRLLQLLPLQEEEEEEGQAASAAYEFEPAPGELLQALIPRYLESQVFQAFLEASASEHAARRRAMKAATDNADDLIERLTRDYNRARQDQITTEIMEVVGGAEALTQVRQEEQGG